MINKNWDRWIFASVSKFFISKSQGVDLWIEGQDRKKEPSEYGELRVTGPIYNQTSPRDYTVEVQINILINVLKDQKDNHRIFRVCGIFEQAFEKCIKVYKLGDTVDDSPATILEILQRIPIGDRELIVTHYGQITPDIRLMQSTIEAAYKMHLRI